MLQTGLAALTGPSGAGLSLARAAETRAPGADLPALIRRSATPLALEAPIDSFNTQITAVERFFVRYNLPNLPGMVDLETWSLKVGGDGAEREINLSLDDLRAMPLREVVAVCQCAGNRRAMAVPPVPGVQWGDGAMGCARWRGVRLRDVLLKAGVRSDTLEVALLGADSARNPDLSPYAKSLPLERAMDAGALIALEMIGAPGLVSLVWHRGLVLRNRATIVDGKSAIARSDTGEQRIACEHLIVATGSEPGCFATT